MKARICLSFAVCLLAAGFAPAGDRPQPSAGHRKMLDWCGEFTITGKTFTSPFGPGRQIKGTWIGKPILDGFAIEGTYFYEGKGPSGETQAREISTYDPATNTYQYVFLSNTGYREQAPFTVDGPVAAWEGTVVIDGKELRFRGRDRDLPDGTGFLRTAEFSTDGQTWQPNMECRHIRVAPASDEQELIRLEDAFCDAVVKKDVVMVDRLLGEDLTLAMADAIHTKAQAMAYLQSDEFNLASLDPEDLKARIYGDMGVVTGVLRWSASDGEWGRDRITDIWLKRDGRWQMVATQQSEIETTVDSAQLSAEMKKLAVFAGKWEYDGEQVDPPVAGLPFGGAGAFSGTVTNRFILDGAFMESTIEDKSPAGLTRTIQITGYDPRTRDYVLETFMSDGTREHAVQTVSPDGRVWTSQSTMTSGTGEQALLRNVVTFSPDRSRLASVVDVSTDGGQTWKHWFTSKDKKLSR